MPNQKTMGSMGGKENTDYSKYSLSELVKSASAMVEGLQNKLSLVEEECAHFKGKYTDIAKKYLSLARKFKEITQGGPPQIEKPGMLARSSDRPSSLKFGV